MQKRFQSLGFANNVAMAECFVRLAQLQSRRDQSDAAVKLLRQGIEIFDACGAGGFQYMGYRARRDLILGLRKLGRDEEANLVLAKRKTLRTKFLSEVPDLARTVFSEVPTLGLENDI